jgi:hypothetical protein
VVLSQKKYIVALYILLALFASIQPLLLVPKTYNNSEQQYTKYNNYIIFKSSFHHLSEGKDLYAFHPEKHWDLYKYPPTFAALFAPFASLPDWLGLNLWNLLNALLFVLAIYYLPVFNNTKKGLILIICMIELMTSIQNHQSNGLMAALIILTFGLLEKKRYLLATLCIVLSAYIKLFGVVGLVLFLFYPKKWKLALYSAMWALALFAVPLLFVSVEQYNFLIHSYLNMLSNDHVESYGYSVMGWLHSWFGIDFGKTVVVALGAIALLVPLCKIKCYANQTFRILMLASILIWVVIFNHKAESPTFIIAMAGVALWFMVSKKNILNITLFVCAFVFASLSPTDIFPKYIRVHFVIPYCLKAVPCIFIWFKIMFNLITFPRQTSQTTATC